MPLPLISLTDPLKGTGEKTIIPLRFLTAIFFPERPAPGRSSPGRHPATPRRAPPAAFRRARTPTAAPARARRLDSLRMRPPPAAGEVAAIELRRRADLRPWRGARRLKELGGARRRRGPPRRGRRTRRGGAARGGSGARSAGREEGRADPARSSPARAAARARPTAREEGRARPAHSSPARRRGARPAAREEGRSRPPGGKGGGARRREGVAGEGR